MKSLRDIVPQVRDTTLSSPVTNDPKTKTSTATKIPGSTPTDEPMTLNKLLYGKPPIQDVTPKASKPMDQTAMPDMDEFVKNEKKPPKPVPPEIALPKPTPDTIPSNTGVARADTPVGSFPKQEPAKIPIPRMKQTFDQAFAQAKKEGKKVFDFEGKSFNTKVKKR